MSGSIAGSVIARRSIDIEKKLNDLQGRAEHLGAMNWYEFQQKHITETPRKWSHDSIFTGGVVGMVAGLAGVLLLGAFGAPVVGRISLYSVLIPMAVGGLIGGMIPSENDKREGQVDAYRNYVDAIEASRGQVTQRQPMETIQLPSLPSP